MTACPNTEALIAEAFKTCLLISGARAAVLLGLDRRILQRMAEAGEIGSTIDGKSPGRIERRKFSERDIRKFLERGGQWACTDPSEKTATVKPSRTSPERIFL